MNNTIGIMREGLSKQGEKRVAITPKYAKQIIQWSHKLIVQPAVNPKNGEVKRIFPDIAYKRYGAEISEDLSSADMIFGLKEIHSTRILPNKAYYLFSHTHKGQLKNQKMLNTFMENNYIFAELSPSTFRNNLDIRHSATLAASYTYNAFSFSLGNTHKSGLPYTTPVIGNEIVIDEGVPVINYNSPNNATLKDYYRTDFSAAYQFQMKGSLSGKLSIAFLNIFNRENSLDTYYILEIDEEKNPTINKIEQFSLGFTPNISFQLLF